jgi:vacuolar protein sorting-associated protein 35
MKYQEGNESDQEILLDEVQTNIGHHAGLLKSVIENGSLRDALKHASGMVKEIGNPRLIPKFYYILCILPGNS